MVPAVASHDPAWTCALHLVPDRKDPSIGRVIFPVCPLNEACRPPHPTPTPSLHFLIRETLRHEWAFTADYRGWFFSLEIPAPVASRFFATNRRGRWACVRGLLGWRWMPYIMASIAQHAAESSVAAGTALTWIDNVIGLSRSHREAQRALRRLRSTSEWLGATLHEVQEPTTNVQFVGLELDLKGKRWRLGSTWPPRFLEASAAVDTLRVLPLRLLWSVVGGAAWALYALNAPPTILRSAIGYLGATAGKFSRREIELDTEVAFPRAVRDDLRSAAWIVYHNPWQRLPPLTTRPPLFTDASGSGGLGAVLHRGSGWVATGTSDSRPSHINTLEMRAVLFGLHQLRRGPPAVLPVVVDSAVVAYQLARGRALPDEADDTLRHILRRSLRLNITLQPRLISTDANPADAPSRGRTWDGFVPNYMTASALIRPSVSRLNAWPVLEYTVNRHPRR